MKEKQQSKVSQRMHGVGRIVSGGQTGVDQAALDVAIELKIPHGGWCPLGRVCEVGHIPAKYKLKESPSPDYATRTQQNVIDSDGTLILYQGKMQGGTALTARYARQFNKPLARVRLDAVWDFAGIVHWLSENNISVLNIAGPRASSNPNIYQLAKDFLIKLASYDIARSERLFD